MELGKVKYAEQRMRRIFPILVPPSLLNVNLKSECKASCIESESKDASLSSNKLMCCR